MKILIKLVTVAAFFLTTVSSASAQELSQDQFNKLMDGYLANDANMEKIGGALERFFRKKRDEQQRNAQQQESQRMEEQFKNPIQVEVGNSPFKGPKDAPVTIIEFSEFQCPFCARGAKTMDQVAKAYPTQVRVVFKHLPLPFHEHAKTAAQAVIAAGNQEKFWEMHDLLFQNQKNLGMETYKKLAKELNLDMAKFEADYAAKETIAQVEADLAQGQKLGVRGTPGFFVNGVQMRGAQPLPAFQKVIDRWLEEGKK